MRVSESISVFFVDLCKLTTCFLFKTVETPSQPASDNTLPVTFDAKEDASVNNLTRADVNCDKTGTCYDGK